jgi:hypothetical protein
VLAGCLDKMDDKEIVKFTQSVYAAMDRNEGLAKLGLFDRCLEISTSRDTR